MNKKLLGYAAVDSGQLIVCDPCYIDSEWDHKDDFKDIRKYKTKKGRKIFEYGKDFSNYDQILIKGKTVNNLLISKELIEIPNKPNHNFSYGGCCSQTLSKEGAGQLKFKKGHSGAGVVFCSGYGDGYYPVYGYLNKDGRCIKVEIIMK